MARLLEFWEFARDEPFQWGQFDCVLFVAGYIEAKTGTHPAPDVVGSYNSAFGARQVIMRAGSLTRLLGGYLSGFPDGSEVGIFQMNNTQICGVSSDKGTAFKTERGLMVTRGAELIKGWNI